MGWWLVASHFACFIAGWVFFKHRAKIKQAAEAEAHQLRQSAASKIAGK